MVVYKNTEDCRQILADPKFLQGKVNKLMRKSVKFSSNPFSDDPLGVDNESENEEPVKDKHREKMEEGGFIMVLPET